MHAYMCVYVCVHVFGVDDELFDVCVCVCVRSPNRQVNKDPSNEPLVETEKDGSSSSKKYPFLHNDLNMTVHICPTENMMHQRAR